MEKHAIRTSSDIAWEPELRALLSHFAIAPENSDGVLFSVVLDGVSYTLVRRPVRQKSTPALAVLSRREAQIVELIAQGLPNKLVADALAISPHTVSAYLRRIFMKLNVTSRSAMVAIVFKKHSTST